MDNNTLALSITKALGMNENGGHVVLSQLKAGKSGELKSIFQFEPSTWKLYAKEVTGKSNLPMNPDNETKIVAEKVYKWLEAGNSPEQIFSMWNAGENEKDAYTGKFTDGQSSVGVNNYGVKFNVPGYVKNGMNYLKQVQPQIASSVAAPEQSTPQGAQQGAQQTSPMIQGGQPQQQSNANPLEAILTKIQSVVNPQSTPIAKRPVMPQIVQGKPGLVAGMLPQYGQKL